MIKKLLGTLTILGLGFFGVSFGDYGYGTIGSSVTSQLNSSYSVSVLNNVEFSTTYLGSLKRVFAFDPDSVFYWNLDGTLSIGFDYWDNKGDIGYFFVCDYISSFDGTFSNCVGYDYSENIDIINNFLTKIKSTDKFVYGGSSGTSETNYLMYLGVISSEVNKTIVFPFGICWSNCSSPLNIDGIDFSGLDNFEVLGNPNYDSHYYIGLNNLSVGGYSFSTIPNDIIGVSPSFNNNSGDIDLGSGGIVVGSTESAINYYEKHYGRNKNICYVGIDNLTDLWGSSVSFQSGTGLNIFEAYSGTYGNPELNKVYVWLNTWLINYEQWFYRETPLYLASYNSGTNVIDLYYNDLTFPFSGNPVAYYFMSDNIESYSPYSTMGSSVVSYCNLKINNGSFDQIIDQADKNNINNYTEQSNKNNGLNPDGTQNKIDYSQFGIYTGDAWVSSGIDIDFSGDTTLKSSIRNFFERIDVLFGDTIETENNNTRKGSRSVGSILPSYIVYGLLFVVLFKLLRRR